VHARCLKLPLGPAALQFCTGKQWGNIGYSSCGTTYDLWSKKDISCSTRRGYDGAKPSVMCYCRV
jgi:hypothetical protein